MHSKPICNAQERNDIDVIESPPNSELSTEHLRNSLYRIRIYWLWMSYLVRSSSIVHIFIFCERESECLYCNLNLRER